MSDGNLACELDSTNIYRQPCSGSYIIPENLTQRLKFNMLRISLVPRCVAFSLEKRSSLLVRTRHLGNMNTIWADVEEALREIEEREPELCHAVRETARANYDSGRIERFLSGGAVQNVRSYVSRMATHYREQREYVTRVQKNQDHELWEALFVKLQKWAYSILSKKQFLEPTERYINAVQCAADAGVVIANRPFPYDTHFDAWAYVTLRFVCLNHMRRMRNEASVPPEVEVSLDRWNGWLQSLRDPGGEQARQRFEQRHDLLKCIGELAEAQRTFVILYYFEQKSYDDIAAITGKNKNALYKVNFDALYNLRKSALWME